MSNEVLVVGAGPTGLSTAITLRRFGLPVRIIDRLPEPATLSKALVVWSGSLEALGGMGVIDDFLAAGRRLHALQVGAGKRKLGEIAVGDRGLSDLVPQGARVCSRALLRAQGRAGGSCGSPGAEQREASRKHRARVCPPHWRAHDRAAIRGGDGRAVPALRYTRVYLVAAVGRRGQDHLQHRCLLQQLRSSLCPDHADDVDRFAELAEWFAGFHVQYVKSSGAVGTYYPDFVVVQSTDEGPVNWIVETKGREDVEVAAKDAQIERWCSEVTAVWGKTWRYMKVPQVIFDRGGFSTFASLVRGAELASAAEGALRLRSAQAWRPHRYRSEG